MKRLLALAVVVLFVTSCATQGDQARTEGTLIGTGLGAAIGAGMGYAIGRSGTAAGIGAAIGGLVREARRPARAERALDLRAEDHDPRRRREPLARRWTMSSPTYLPRRGG